MYNHYNHTYNAIKRKYEFCAKNNLELINWQNSLKKSLSKLLGLENIKFDLNNHEPSFEMHKSDDMGDYIREEWKMLTEPSVLLPFYVLRPKGKNNKFTLPMTEFCSCKYISVCLSIRKNKATVKGIKDA